MVVRISNYKLYIEKTQQYLNYIKLMHTYHILNILQMDYV